MTNGVTSIPIPAILEIKKGAIFNLEQILTKHDFTNAVFLFDDFTYENYKDKVMKTISSIKITPLLLTANLNIQDLISQAFSMERFEVVVAIGGGGVIDYGKYIAFSRRSPFISIPTSASNDGFASSNCSLIVDQKKTTVPARVPYGIIADLDIIQNVPERFILAGIGDLMSNITALFDWEYEEKMGVSSVNAFAHMISKKAVNSFIRTPMDDIKNPIFLKELVSSLTMGGISTVISGNSSPISGSEHLISHALDKISENPQMHGIQVGICTYIMAIVQNHRVDRMEKVFSRTGFFDYVKTLNIQKHEYKKAIQLAPSIKPGRYTYIHDETFRKEALQVIESDKWLKEILK
ncbi:iron-containing alcohol dehydrogenase family protein [Bacillus sp. 31A1R]|uniref:Iron-containing alcohol dehydrogenase family protein n=1 Tax=Robertmurraya mangrovi TaxID=3098077 RepID=A0ABU5J372_9BACI|nr:iron-containing alcohol dehydrogenase family protein [Bacillus sp. 31A1R]MDZ5473870.1 iron-containing alcohol dehydrogenase family protein [Bacillus sp. 31A1R]